MSNRKAKAANIKPAAAAAPSTPKPVRVQIPPLFRRIDWITLAITFAVVWTTYFLTLAPELTLEDSGELCTGAYYAGIPHPPGYPFWAIYAWLWTAILPVGNIAWRVEVGEATAAAMACGFVGLMVSRGSSMLVEGIEVLKDLTGKWENAICVVSGVAAGLILGLGGVMWSESVAINRISLFGVPWLMVVLTCLLRWIYAPHQRRYLYCAMFFFGICATIHQTLLVAAMGIEAAIIAAQPRLGRDVLFGNAVIYLFIWYANAHHWLPQLLESLNNPIVSGLFHIIGLGSIIGCSVLVIRTHRLMTEWLPCLFMFVLWAMGASFYFYEPIAGMTNPPMQWGYPRTVEGFFHALSRGQYEKANPTDVIHDPARFLMQLGMLVGDVAEEFNWVVVFIALLPFLFFLKMKKRERSWIIGLSSIYVCIGVLLIILMNPSPDRQSADLIKVFFTSSHAVIAIMAGYGLALSAAYMATHYQRFRPWGLTGGGVAAALAIYSLASLTQDIYFGESARVSFSQLCALIGRCFTNKDQYALPVYAGLVLVGIAFVFLAALLLYRNRAPLAITLGLFALMPLYSGLCHWAGSEQRGHWFGYWFGHDMFTPPFIGPDGKFSYDAKLRAQAMKGPNADLVYPEMTRNAVLYGGTDPGRFCPTYMIFCESFTPHNCQPLQDQQFDRRDVYIITQNALADGTYLNYIRAQYNRSTQHDPYFFQELLRSPRERDENYTTNILARIAGALLDKPLTALGASIEARRRREGVYPRNEIYIASPDDSSRCFQEYLADAQHRLQLHELKPGEDVKIIDNKVQVSGQTAVMAINGLLTKVMFDHNPTNEFFVEESFPLNWMYPHLTPFGVIMKINRQPLPSLTEDILRRDHEFWSRYSERLIGTNVVTYDTTVRDVAAFVEKVYLRHDYSGFKGDLKFVRDDQAQKSFSKLRSSIAGVYAWRLIESPPEYRPKNAEYQRLFKEADFAFRQAFAFCPYSPEAVFRYANLLVGQPGRLDDALLITETALKLDPENVQIANLIKDLRAYKERYAARGAELSHMEEEVRTDPTNYQAAFNLAYNYLSIQQTDRATRVLDAVVNEPHADAPVLLFAARAYTQIGNWSKLEATLEKLVRVVPEEPEPWYDLATLKLSFAKTNESLSALRRALELSARRLEKQPGASNLVAMARSDARLDPLRQLPEFQKLVPPR